ncbi:MAG: WYL domain-containing protein [Clostridia bacterium]|nr:WYL domain-containing protein [Clostridia bacterium]
MAGSENQKLKLLHLYKILLEETDEDHPLTTPQILERLAAKGIRAERKSIYADLDALQEVFDVDIVRSGRKGCYIASRDFDLAELKMMTDSVLSSRFITQTRTTELVEKIRGLASRYQRRQLTGRLYVADRVKSMNASVYNSVDTIASAISGDRKISFRYFTYDWRKEKQYHHDGEQIVVSPFELVWDNEFYYLVAFADGTKSLRHYRVDRMENIRTQTKQPREGREAFAGAKVQTYSKRMFSMYSGEEVNVTLRFANQLSGVVIDRFGKDVILAPDGEGHFRMSATVAVSPQFYGWLFGLGADAQILAPADVREAYKDMLARVAAQYGEPTSCTAPSGTRR